MNLATVVNNAEYQRVESLRNSGHMTEDQWRTYLIGWRTSTFRYSRVASHVERKPVLPVHHAIAKGWGWTITTDANGFPTATALERVTR